VFEPRLEGVRGAFLDHWTKWAGILAAQDCSWQDTRGTRESYLWSEGGLGRWLPTAQIRECLLVLLLVLLLLRASAWTILEPKWGKSERDRKD